MMLFEFIFKLDVHKQSLKAVSTLIQHMKSQEEKKKNRQNMKDSKSLIGCLVKVSIKE